MRGLYLFVLSALSLFASYAGKCGVGVSLIANVLAAFGLMPFVPLGLVLTFCGVWFAGFVGIQVTGRLLEKYYPEIFKED